MLSILTVSKKSEGLPFYRRFQNEGCVSKYYSAEGGRYQGVRCVSNYRDTIESSDVVYITSPGLGGLGEEVNAGGRVVFGGTKFGDFLLTEDGGKTLIRLLDSQDLESGVPITFLGIFNKGKWQKPFYASLQYTRFMDKDKGAILPYAGNVGMYFDTGLAVDKIFSQIEFMFESSGFTGVFEISIILYENEFKVLGFRPYVTPLFYNYVELLVPTFSEFLLKGSTNPIDFRYGKVTMGVELTIPYQVQDCVKITEQAEKHFWTINDDYVIGWSTAWGKDLVEAYRRTYRTIRNIVLKPEVQYREDIGFKKMNAEDVFFILKEWGWIDATIKRKVQESIQLEREGANRHVQENGENRE